MRKAVSRSVYNVVHEANTASLFDSLYQKVWQYTPKPTPESARFIANLITTYTNPGNAKLVQAAADVLGEKYGILIAEAMHRGHLVEA